MHADNDHGHVTTAFDCTVCGHEPLLGRADRSVICPDCEQAYSLALHDGFALIATNGWVNRVSLDHDADPTTAPAGE